MENKQKHTRKHKRKNNNNNNTKPTVGSKTVTQGLNLLKDISIGIGSLICTAASEISEAIRSAKNKN